MNFVVEGFKKLWNTSVTGPVHHNKWATADLSETSLSGFKTSGLHGVLLENCNFIFTWEDNETKKMILVKNSGAYIRSGSLKYNTASNEVNNWMQPSTWKEEDGYMLSNFKGIKYLTQGKMILKPNSDRISLLLTVK